MNLKRFRTINLSSEPFRKDRPLVAGSIVLSVILGALLVTLTWMAVLQQLSVKDARTAIAAVEKQLATLDREQAQLNITLRQPGNSDVFEQSLFLNGLLARKGISWTKIFSDLETVVPPNVRVISVRPQVNGQNQIQLDLFVGSQGIEPVVDMLMKLEGSPVFGKTAIANWLPPSQTEPLYRYRLTVNYVQKL
ncbi:MAG: hypothetical protein NTV70_19405 [Acidobacteria bacterium]|nr:hypothetical protein [Acidobacteriota bacterium]